MKTITQLFGNNDVEITFINASPSGHGHYKINGEARISGTNETLKISFVTSNMPAIDILKGDDEELAEQMQVSFAEDLSSKNEGKILEWKEELEANETED